MYVIKFDNDSYNKKFGFEVNLFEATIYESINEAQKDAESLCDIKGIFSLNEEKRKEIKSSLDVIISWCKDLSLNKKIIDFLYLAKKEIEL